MEESVKLNSYVMYMKISSRWIRELNGKKKEKKFFFFRRSSLIQQATLAVEHFEGRDKHGGLHTAFPAGDLRRW